MKIKKIEWSNIASYGNRPQEIIFSEKGGEFILLMGKNGSGKCLEKNTHLKVRVCEKSKKEFLDFLGTREKTSYYVLNLEEDTITCSIHQIYVFEMITGIVSQTNDFFVETQYGFRQIQEVAVTALNEETVEIVTEKRKVKCSENHLFVCALETWKKAKDFCVGDVIKTIDGWEKIIEINSIGISGVLYDLQVAEVHEFYANGFVSHNSTIANIIKIGGYGKSGIPKGNEIANRINGNGKIVLNVEAKGKDIVIERSFKPDKDTKLFIEGVDCSDKLPSRKKETNKDIEEDILDFPFHVFNNLVTLSINDFKSLIKMDKKDKRLIFDRIFGFYIFNDMRDMNNKKMKEVKEEIFGYEKEISVTLKNIENSKKKLDDFVKKINEDHSFKVEELEATLSTLQEQKIGLDTIFSKLISDKKSVEAKLKEINQHGNKLLIDIRTIKEKEKLYSNDKCPTCSSDLSSEFHVHIKESLSTEKEELGKLVSEMQSNKEFVNNELNKIIEKEQSLSKKTNDLLVSLNVTKKEIETLKNSTNSEDQTKSLLELITSLEESNEGVKKSKEAISLKYSFLTLVDDILSEKGAKAEIIKNILPALNQEIYRFSEKMNLDYTIIFDEEFNTKLYMLGYEVLPSSCSTGEMKKLDFVALVSVIKLMKLKYSNSMNVLFLDEIFSSLDNESITAVLHILKELSRDLSLNIFVVNHSPLPTEMFDKVIEVEKVNGFSELKIS